MDELKRFANQLADAAAAITLPAFRAPKRVEMKADASPVTQADKAAEEAMRALIMQRFPQHGIRGEEYGSHQPEAEFQWILDPIDGTRAFMAGYPSFSTLIGVTQGGKELLGVADFPALSLRFHGTCEAALCNGNAVKASKVADLKHAVIATTSTYYFSDTQRAAFDAMAKHCLSYQLGGDAYPYVMLASGAVDLALDVGVHYHDIAAMLPILKGAGAAVHITEGTNIGIIAASTEALLSSALDAFPL